MIKFSKRFFDSDRVLFVGYSLSDNAFSKMIYEAMSNNGLKVYPVNPKADGKHEIKVYRNLDEISDVPKAAFVLLNPANIKQAVQDLANKGVKKILFQGKVNAEVAHQCDKLGIEAAGGCPMMVYGKGFHKIHAFFAGVR